VVLVIDTSITMAWCFADEADDIADAALDALRDDEAAVPCIWPLEVANVLLVAERRGRLSQAQCARFLGLLGALPIQVDHSVPIAEVSATAQRHGLTAYDASYLMLAERLGGLLATLDDRLAAAATRAGVQLHADR
jgi:predicted nucleic acid-binding protein